MAGMVWLRWYGEYSGAPEEVVNRSGWIPNSTAAARAAALMPRYPPMPAATTRRRPVRGTRPETRRYTAYATKGRITAMLTTFTPYDSTPPSPKSRAWNSRATDTAITAAQGPRQMAMMPPPTACAVVPSGIGTLNIITRNDSAAKTASIGMFRVLTTLVTRRLATT